MSCLRCVGRIAFVSTIVQFKSNVVLMIVKHTRTAFPFETSKRAPCFKNEGVHWSLVGLVERPREVGEQISPVLAESKQIE